jgi:hypothetical protein
LREFLGDAPAYRQAGRLRLRRTERYGESETQILTPKFSKRVIPKNIKNKKSFKGAIKGFIFEQSSRRSSCLPAGREHRNELRKSNESY